jgi:hypothetical protein
LPHAPLYLGGLEDSAVAKQLLAQPGKCQFPLLTLLDASDFTRLATGNPKSGPALPPGSGGSRGDAKRHPFPSP